MAKEDETPNGTAPYGSSKPESSFRRNLLTISILILVITVFTSYLLNYNSISVVSNSTTEEAFSLKKAKQSKQQNSDIDATKEAIEMVRFLDQLLDSNLDDTVTVEQSNIRLRDVLRFNNVHFAPRIASIVKMDPFKFAKFNLKRPCTLWPDVFSCTKMYACLLEFNIDFNL